MTETILGVNNAFALRHWPEPAEWARVVAEDIGLREVQFSLDLLDPLIPTAERAALCKAISDAAHAHQLTLRTTFTGLLAYAQNHLAHPDPIARKHAQQWYLAALEITQQLSAEACGGHIGTLSLADFSHPQRRTWMRGEVIEQVRTISHAAAALGQRYFLWEFMPTARELIHTPDEAQETLQEVNVGAGVPVLLCFDLGHCISAGGTRVDPHAWLERLLPWTPVVHLQQTDGQADRHWPFSPQYNRAGIIDPRRVVEIVRHSPFERVLLHFEFAYPFDVAPEEIIKTHRQSLDVWSRWL